MRPHDPSEGVCGVSRPMVEEGEIYDPSSKRFEKSFPFCHNSLPDSSLEKVGRVELRRRVTAINLDTIAGTFTLQLADIWQYETIPLRQRNLSIQLLSGLSCPWNELLHLNRISSALRRQNCQQFLLSCCRSKGREKSEESTLRYKEINII